MCTSDGSVPFKGDVSNRTFFPFTTSSSSPSYSFSPSTPSPVSLLLPPLPSLLRPICDETAAAAAETAFAADAALLSIRSASVPKSSGLIEGALLRRRVRSAMRAVRVCSSFVASCL